MGSPFFVSAKRRGGPGMAGRKRRQPVSGKEDTAFFGEQRLFSPGRDPLAFGNGRDSQNPMKIESF